MSSAPFSDNSAEHSAAEALLSDKGTVVDGPFAHDTNDDAEVKAVMATSIEDSDIAGGGGASAAEEEEEEGEGGEGAANEGEEEAIIPQQKPKKNDFILEFDASEFKKPRKKKIIRKKSSTTTGDTCDQSDGVVGRSGSATTKAAAAKASSRRSSVSSASGAPTTIKRVGSSSAISASAAAAVNDDDGAAGEGGDGDDAAPLAPPPSSGKGSRKSRDDVAMEIAAQRLVNRQKGIASPISVAPTADNTTSGPSSSAAAAEDGTSGGGGGAIPEQQRRREHQRIAADHDPSWVYNAPPNNQRTLLFAEDWPPPSWAVAGGRAGANAMVRNPLAEDSHFPLVYDNKFIVLSFSSEFDSGNLIQVERTAAYTYNLHCSPDCGNSPVQTNNKQWFHFSVRGLPKGVAIKCTMVGVANSKMYTFGWVPVSATVPLTADTKAFIIRANTSSGAMEAASSSGANDESIEGILASGRSSRANSPPCASQTAPHSIIAADGSTYPSNFFSHTSTRVGRMIAAAEALGDPVAKEAVAAMDPATAAALPFNADTYVNAIAAGEAPILYARMPVRDAKAVVTCVNEPIQVPGYPALAYKPVVNKIALAAKEAAAAKEGGDDGEDGGVGGGSGMTEADVERFKQGLVDKADVTGEGGAIIANESFDGATTRIADLISRSKGVTIVPLSPCRAGGRNSLTGSAAVSPTTGSYRPSPSANAAVVGGGSVPRSEDGATFLEGSNASPSQMLEPIAGTLSSEEADEEALLLANGGGGAQPSKSGLNSISSAVMGERIVAPVGRNNNATAAAADGDGEAGGDAYADDGRDDLSEGDGEGDADNQPTQEEGEEEEEESAAATATTAANATAGSSAINTTSGKPPTGAGPKSTTSGTKRSTTSKVGGVRRGPAASGGTTSTSTSTATSTAKADKPPASYTISFDVSSEVDIPFVPTSETEREALVIVMRRYSDSNTSSGGTSASGGGNTSPHRFNASTGSSNGAGVLASATATASEERLAGLLKAATARFISPFPQGHPKCPALFVSGNHPYSHGRMCRHLLQWRNGVLRHNEGLLTSGGGIGGADDATNAAGFTEETIAADNNASSRPSTPTPAAAPPTVLCPTTGRPLPMGGIYYNEEVLCTSLDGHDVHLLTITGITRRTKVGPQEEIIASVNGRRAASTDAAGADAGDASLAVTNVPCKGTRPLTFPSKKYIVISARIHPGETPASYMQHGAMDFILHPTDPRAARLRKDCVILIVPIINPDGTMRGHSRADTTGQNLNRCYRDPSFTKHPSPFVVRNLLLFLQQRGRLHLYLDLHAHANKKGVFAYGNSMESVSMVQSMLYAKLVAMNSPYFEFPSCNFSENNMFAVGKTGEGKDSSSRVTIYQDTGFIHSYTVEANYVAAAALNPVIGIPHLPANSHTVSYTKGQLYVPPSALVSAAAAALSPAAAQVALFTGNQPSAADKASGGSAAGGDVPPPPATVPSRKCMIAPGLYVIGSNTPLCEQQDVPPTGAAVPTRYSPATLADVGRGLVLGFMDLHNLQPEGYSRVAMSTFKSSKAVGQAISRYMMVDVVDAMRRQVMYRCGISHKEFFAALKTTTSGGRTPSVGRLSLLPSDFPSSYTAKASRTFPATTIFSLGNIAAKYLVSNKEKEGGGASPSDADNDTVLWSTFTTSAGENMLGHGFVAGGGGSAPSSSSADGGGLIGIGGGAVSSSSSGLGGRKGSILSSARVLAAAAEKDKDRDGPLPSINTTAVGSSASASRVQSGISTPLSSSAKATSIPIAGGTPPTVVVPIAGRRRGGSGAAVSSASAANATINSTTPPAPIAIKGSAIGVSGASSAATSGRRRSSVTGDGANGLGVAISAQVATATPASSSSPPSCASPAGGGGGGGNSQASSARTSAVLPTKIGTPTTSSAVGSAATKERKGSDVTPLTTTGVAPSAKAPPVAAGTTSKRRPSPAAAAAASTKPSTMAKGAGATKK